MPRTLINLSDDDKHWLDQEARSRRKPMTELVREAVRNYRMQQESSALSGLQAALARTHGIWRQGDGSAWQQRLRDEGGECR